MDTNTQAPPVDMLEQAGDLLRRFAKGEAISGTLYHERNAEIVQASAMLAIAAELRSIHNVLHEINQRMESVDSLASMAENVAIWGTGS